MSTRTATWLAWSLCLLCGTLAAVSLSLAFLNGRTLGEFFVEEGIVMIATLTVAFSVVGALVASHHPGNPIGWIFCAAALFQGLVISGDEYAFYALITEPGSLPLGAEASWLGEWIWAPGLGLILVFLPLLFPDGRPPSRRWRLVAWLGGLSVGLFCTLTSILFWSERGTQLLRDTDIAVGGPGWLVALLSAAFPLMLVAGLAAVTSMFVRFRRARGDERQQLKWFASASALSFSFVFVFEELPTAGGSLLEAGLAVVGVILVPSIPVATGVAIFKYRLYDIDLIINRTLVYGALTACVVGIYVLVVGYLGVLFRVQDNLLVSLAATGLVAVLFAPLRDRLQRAVNRLMYGERDDPYAVISRLGERLEATLEPGAVLPTVARTVREALKLPYAAVELGEGNGSFVAAESGSAVKAPLRLPLVYGGEPVGELLLGSRDGEEDFSPTDRRLLEDLARQAGIAVHAVRLTNDLQRSRERLVTTREEERRRLRRDLHDGLGPTLGSLPLKLDVADDLVEEDPAAARELLRGLKSQAKSAVVDIRRLVYALRPPALDDLGLSGALREAAAQHGANGLRVSVQAPEELPPLPAAVEVAAYRIVQEAVTNVSRHAAASECVVRLALDEKLETLRLEIEDDGRGIEEERGQGLGLHSMRERAAELGGECVVEPGPAGGTCVYTSLPIADSKAER